MLNWHLAKWGFLLNDNKSPTRNTLDMGFEVVPRTTFHERLSQAVRRPDRRGRWQVEADLSTVAQWQPSLGAANASPQSAQPNYVNVGTARVGAILMPVAGRCSERLALAESFCALL